MDNLTLNCWIRSETIDSGVFQVEISKTKTIAALKEAIRTIALPNVAAHTLPLYKLSPPVVTAHLRKIILSKDAEPLKTTLDELSQAFPKSLPKNHIHLIVDAPQEIICWQRGHPLKDKYEISILPDTRVGELIHRIKKAELELRDVAEHNVRLYRISGDNKELLEHLSVIGDGELLQGKIVLPHFLGQPVLDPLYVVAEVISSAVFGEEDKIATARKAFTDHRFKGKSPSDSLRPSAFRRAQGRKDTQIPCGRPCEPEEIIPVTLSHPVFGQFLDHCQIGTVTEADNQFAGKLAKVMSDIYQDDDSHANAVNNVFKEVHLNFKTKAKIPGTTYEMDAILDIDDEALPPYFIAEFKNKAAVINSEPYLQAVAYYLEVTKEFAPRLSASSLPCFILILLGPYIVFAGAAWNLRPVVQVLSTPLAFNYHSTDTQNQLTVARHMAAFRKALETLRSEYQSSSTALSFDKTVFVNKSYDTVFPYSTKFTSLDDNSAQNIRYTKQLEEDGNKTRLVFFGTLEEDPTVQICIKFARRYSKEAHQHCADLFFAPKLRGFEVLPGGWYKIVMDDLAGYVSLADLPDTDHLPKSVFESIRTQLKTLHARKLVHGDIRDTNIFVKKDDRTKFMIIDFDWAGVEGAVRYPPYVNHVDIQRPTDARDGELVTAAHDLEMLDVITERWAVKHL